MTSDDTKIEIESSSLLHPLHGSSHGSILSVDRDVDDILHDLKIFASLKENERISTTSGVFVNKASDKMAALTRFYYGETRHKNLSYIEKRFFDAFERIDQYLQQRDMMLTLKPENMSREQVLYRRKNNQTVTRLLKGIGAAKERLSRVLKTTYEQDVTSISRIERICEDIEDRLNLVNVSIKYIEDREINKMKSE